MKIFIPCAGLGSRLDYLTKSLNKSLVSICDKPAISHIIDKLPQNFEFVIALGYYGDILKQYLLMAYPHINFTFVNITPFEGPGSGLGITLHQCKEYLQESFLFIPTDSFFESDLISLSEGEDCIFFSDIKDEDFQYRKVKIYENYLSEITNKDSRGLVYTGICFIKNYIDFWNSIELNDEFILSGESYILNKLSLIRKIKCIKIDWKDIGNLKSIEIFRNENKSKYNILDKENESIWFLKDKVIKYNNDKIFIKNRVDRFKILNNFVPKLISYSDNMYCYQFQDGESLSKKFDLELMKKLINYLDVFWNLKQDKECDLNLFFNNCFDFYKTKTIYRIESYKKISQIDCEIVNGVRTGTIEELISLIDWNYISKGIPSNFHGDLHFENIIIDKEHFYLLDWRQDFNGDLYYGDLYYDFAKLNHGMIISHDIIKNQQYNLEYKSSNSLQFDFYLKNQNIMAQEIFFDFLDKKGFDVRKVKIMTALIFLNIACLHHEPYNHLLYYLGKLQLFNLLKEK